MSLVLPGLFHLSVLLFLFGLFHYSNNDAVDVVVLSSALICFGLYLFASIVIILPFWQHMPHSALFLCLVLVVTPLVVDVQDAL
jgi:uncharacterized membrane protein